MNLILALHLWAVFPMKDDGTEYDTTSSTAFYCYRVHYIYIVNEYFMEDPKENYQSTALW